MSELGDYNKSVVVCQSKTFLGLKYRSFNNKKFKQIQNMMDADRDIVLTDLTKYISNFIFFSYGLALPVQKIQDCVCDLTKKIKPLRGYENELFFYLYQIILRRDIQNLSKEFIIITKKPHFVMMKFGDPGSKPFRYFIDLDKNLLNITGISRFTSVPPPHESSSAEFCEMDEEKIFRVSDEGNFYNICYSEENYQLLLKMHKEQCDDLNLVLKKQLEALQYRRKMKNIERLKKCYAEKIRTQNITKKVITNIRHLESISNSNQSEIEINEFMNEVRTNRLYKEPEFRRHAVKKKDKFTGFEKKIMESAPSIYQRYDVKKEENSIGVKKSKMESATSIYPKRYRVKKENSIGVKKLKKNRMRSSQRNAVKKEKLFGVKKNRMESSRSIYPKRYDVKKEEKPVFYPERYTFSFCKKKKPKFEENKECPSESGESSSGESESGESSSGEDSGEE